jgi:hypothetical protein
MQGVPGIKVIILGDNVGHSKQKGLRVHVSYYGFWGRPISQYRSKMFDKKDIIKTGFLDFIHRPRLSERQNCQEDKLRKTCYVQFLIPVFIVQVTKL